GGRPPRRRGGGASSADRAHGDRRGGAARRAPRRECATNDQQCDGRAVTRSVVVSKVRVYELAKETGLPNKEVIRRLAELGVEARSHSSTVAESDASAFRDSLGKL